MRFLQCSINCTLSLHYKLGIHGIVFLDFCNFLSAYKKHPGSSKEKKDKDKGKGKKGKDKAAALATAEADESLVDDSAPTGPVLSKITVNAVQIQVTTPSLSPLS